MRTHMKAARPQQDSQRLGPCSRDTTLEVRLHCASAEREPWIQPLVVSQGILIIGERVQPNQGCGNYVTPVETWVTMAPILPMIQTATFVALSESDNDNECQECVFMVECFYNHRKRNNIQLNFMRLGPICLLICLVKRCSIFDH